MAEAVEWPSAVESDAAAGPAARDAELRLQLTTLQLVSGSYGCRRSCTCTCTCSCSGLCHSQLATDLACQPVDCTVQVGLTVRRDPAALQGFQDAGGFTRITCLLQWAALTFGSTVEDAADFASSRARPAQQGGLAAEPAAGAAAATSAAAAAAGAARHEGQSSGSGSAPGADASGAPNPFYGPQLPPLPPSVRTPADSGKFAGGPISTDAPPTSPLAHPLPHSRQRLDSARVGTSTIQTSEEGTRRIHCWQSGMCCRLVWQTQVMLQACLTSCC